MCVLKTEIVNNGECLLSVIYGGDDNGVIVRGTQYLEIWNYACQLLLFASVETSSTKIYLRFNTRIMEFSSLLHVTHQQFQKLIYSLVCTVKIIMIIFKLKINQISNSTPQCYQPPQPTKNNKNLLRCDEK